MEPAFPNEKPVFLFDDIERTTRSDINTDTYRALKAERDSLASQLEKAKNDNRSLRDEKDNMDGENRSLRAMVDKITTTAREDLPESERDSLLKMVFGMAVAAYQYNPEKNRNSATGENRESIAADLSRLGLNLDADTVRKFIKEAEERFSDLIPKSDNS